MGEWKYSFTVLDVGTRWKKLTVLPHHSQVNRPPYAFDRRKGGPQKPDGMLWGGEYSSPFGNQAPVFQPVALRYTD
jgi:hypothetical protein